MGRRQGDQMILLKSCTKCDPTNILAKLLFTVTVKKIAKNFSQLVYFFKKKSANLVTLVDG
jgi:hypothetical protein